MNIESSLKRRSREGDEGGKYFCEKSRVEVEYFELGVTYRVDNALGDKKI